MSVHFCFDMAVLMKSQTGKVLENGRRQKLKN